METRIEICSTTEEAVDSVSPGGSGGIQDLQFNLYRPEMTGWKVVGGGGVITFKKGEAIR